MRHLHTIACAALCLVVGGHLDASAEAQATPTADSTSAESADRYTSGDLMAESSRDRRIWITAFMAGAANAVALRDVEGGRCISRWYDATDMGQLGLIERSMTSFPESRPAEVIFALARRACPDFIPNN